jgi:hypothetical protein
VEEPDETVDLTATEEPVHVRVQESPRAYESGRAQASQRPQAPRRTIVFDDNDDLDVPDFLK